MLRENSPATLPGPVLQCGVPRYNVDQPDLRNHASLHMDPDDANDMAGKS